MNRPVNPVETIELNTSDPSLVLNCSQSGKRVLSFIKTELRKCASFRFYVAFVNQSGVISLLEELLELERRGIRGQVLVSQYLNFTEPMALRSLLKLSNLKVKIQTRGAMHAKGFFFTRQRSERFLIGSSNWTSSALSKNTELNVVVESAIGSDLVSEVSEEFDRRFDEAETVNERFIEAYAIDYHNSQSQRVAPPRESNAEVESHRLVPNLMQKEALESLQHLREKGERKGLVISATGTGKTFLAAFDVEAVKAKRILFIVHRETVTRAAMQTFKMVFGQTRTYGVFAGGEREISCDFVFTTVQTLSRKSNLEEFSATDFDYIVIDESHRAGAESYRRVLSYFSPDFLLGMTATPERTDGADIFELFSYNLAYEIRLHRALAEGLLCPFHYFGISELSISGYEIDDVTEFNRLVSSERVTRILEATERYGTDNGTIRGLVFCSRKKEAIELARAFSERGVRSIALTGEHSEEDRETAISRLEAAPEDPEKLDYLFTVEIFNEGVDIPKVNQVVMLRPTSSAIVFVQQLGRGLRKIPGREKYLTVIDFIGNYASNFMIPIALYGERSMEKDQLRKQLLAGNEPIPGTSTVNFDRVSRDRIFKSIAISNFSTLAKLKEDYSSMRCRLGRIPSMVDFLDHHGRDPKTFCDHSKSFYNFVRKVEDHGKVADLDHIERTILEVYSKHVLNGTGLEEPRILKSLLSSDTANLNGTGSSLASKVSKRTKIALNNGALQGLNLKFTRVNERKKLVRVSEKLGFEDDLLLVRNGIVFLSKEAKKIFRGRIRPYLLDLAEYGHRKFWDSFVEDEFSGGFVAGRKYERSDVFRILGWNENPVAQNVGGYLKAQDGESCPIFVTYEKAEDSSATTQYEDRLLDRSTMEWFTKSRRKLSSPDVQYFFGLSEGQRLPVFVKKNDDEGKSFYYLGDGFPDKDSFEERMMPDGNGGSVSVVRILLRLPTPINLGLFEYLTAEAVVTG